MPLAEIYDYFKSYDKKSFAVFAQQGHEPSKKELAAFEKKIGFKLPDDFREFALHPLGGLYMEVKEEFWARPKAGDVGPFWSFLYGLQVYSLSSEAPDWLQMAKERADFLAEWSSPNVPFLRIIGNADPYCFTPEGKIVIWQHEEPENPELIETTFSEVLMREIRNLEERKERKLRGEDRAT